MIGEPKALARAPRAASRDKDRARAGRSGRVPAVFQRIQAK
ncbi:hypothetical protein [Streptomyces sp. ST1020]